MFYMIEEMPLKYLLGVSFWTVLSYFETYLETQKSMVEHFLQR